MIFASLFWMEWEKILYGQRRVFTFLAGSNILLHYYEMLQPTIKKIAELATDE